MTGYVRTNLHRMDYPRYREEGWQIGSGHIEAGCKTVVNQRLKQSGCAGAVTGLTPCATSGRCTKAKPVNGMPSGNDPSTNNPAIYQQKRRSPSLLSGH